MQIVADGIFSKMAVTIAPVPRALLTPYQPHPEL